MLNSASATRSNDGKLHALANRGSERKIEAILHSVCIHAGKQNFSGTQLLSVLSPLHCVQLFGLTAAACVHLPITAISFLNFPRVSFGMAEEVRENE